MRLRLLLNKAVYKVYNQVNQRFDEIYECGKQEDGFDCLVILLAIFSLAHGLSLLSYLTTVILYPIFRIMSIEKF